MIFYSCRKEMDLKECAEFIDNGKIVIFPTDTVYGIGCNPFNEASVFKLFEIKNRPLNKLFPILTNDISNLNTYANITDEAKILTEYFWPGQLTIILKIQDNTPFPKQIFHESIAFRIPNNNCTLKLIQHTRKKLLIGTSANLSGQQPITNINSLKNSGISDYDAVITNEVDYILDNSQTLKNNYINDISKNNLITKNSIAQEEDKFNISPQVSTIIDLVEPSKPKIKREGIIPKEQIFEVLARKM